jgi:hypothetical protein
MAAMILVVALLTLFAVTLAVSTATVARDLAAQFHGHTVHPQRNAAYPFVPGPRPSGA